MEQKLTVSPLLENFPGFYVNRKFISMFTTAPTAPYLKPDESTPRSHTFLNILSFHLCVFLLGFSTKALRAFLTAPMRATHSAHPTFFI
jgi:hypothetical protein